MYKSKIDLAVLILFFNRPEKLKKVFESVKEARPSRLYLYQDGAREGREDDIENVAKCREIVSNIDWDCKVFTKFQEKNYGCDPSEYIAQKWMFETEEYAIVLEDDDVPSQSFYPYCKELLERYKDDERIAIICGMNNFDIEKSVDTSYFFSRRGSIWGWASWRRFINLWDEKYTWLQDATKLEKIKNSCEKKYLNFGEVIKTAQKHADSGRAHYESIMFAAVALNDMINIVPKYNMITNIGVGGESTHGADDIRLLPKRTQKLLNKKTYEIDFPLVHPTEIICNKKYDNKYKINFIQKTTDNVEKFFRVLYFKGPKEVLNKIKKRLVK